ncbi:hypothetical protein AB0M46_05395 [Dactylosporangium sp. NPDC051485]|uniref:hypothetical protein n=1 Tax=Dactylosporangium sp. NPDC051485 TaxID=3154846 RepID=UPI00342BBE47
MRGLVGGDPFTQDDEPGSGLTRSKPFDPKGFTLIRLEDATASMPQENQIETKNCCTPTHAGPPFAVRRP